MRIKRLIIFLILCIAPLWFEGCHLISQQSQSQNSEASINEMIRKANLLLLAGDSASASVIYHDLARRNLHEKPMNQTLAAYEEVSNLSRNHNDTIWAHSLIAQATILDIIGKKQEALNKLTPVATKSSISRKIKLSAQIKAADLHVDLGQTTPALPLLDTALNYSLALKDSQYISAVHQTYGNLWFYKNEYDKSLAHYLNALDYYPHINNMSGKPNIYNNIGQLYLILQQPEQALDFGQRAYNLANINKSEFEMYTAKYIIGSAQLDLDKESEGQENVVHALTYFKAKNRHHYTARCLLTLTSALLKNENFTSAKKHLEELEKIIDETQSPYIQYHYQLYNFDYSILTNKIDESKLILDHLQNLVPSPSLSLQRSYLQRKMIYHEKSNQYKAAHLASKKLRDIELKLLNIGKARVINNLQSKFNEAENEKKILTLTLENEKKNKTISQQNIKLWSAAILGILSCLFFAVFFLQNRRIKNQNITIQNSLEERETLLREIHHRVKNNLQVISSLLFLQAETIKDKKALAALQEGRNRVKSMALIHQNLYQEDNLIGVNTNTYFTKLISGLMSSYSIDREKIKINLSIESEPIDIDNLVPLALITNELISNSLKHAFPENKSGSIYFEFKVNNKKISIIQSDDGVGFDNAEDIQHSESFGFQLINILSKKLNATIEFSGTDGFYFQLTCPTT